MTHFFKVHYRARWGFDTHKTYESENAMKAGLGPIKGYHGKSSIIRIELIAAEPIDVTESYQ